jgi:hypothetical protein
VRILAQQAEDDLLKLGGQRLAELGWRRWLLVSDRLQDHAVVLPAEGPAASERLVEHDAQRPEVGALVDVVTAGLFRRHVGDGPEPQAGPGQTQVLRLGEPEVEDLEDPVLGDDQIGWLDVAVYDPACVRSRQAPCRLPGEIQRLALGQRSPIDLLLDGLAFVERHGDEGAAALGFPDFVDRADVRMLQRRRRPGFLEKPLLDGPVERPLGRQKFERNGTGESGIHSPIEDTHAPDSKQLFDSIAGDFLSDKAVRVLGRKRSDLCGYGLEAGKRDHRLQWLQNGVGLVVGREKGRHA